ASGRTGREGAGRETRCHLLRLRGRRRLRDRRRAGKRRRCRGCVGGECNRRDACKDDGAPHPGGNGPDDEEGGQLPAAGPVSRTQATQSCPQTGLIEGPTLRLLFGEWHRPVAPGVEVGEITSHGLALSRLKHGFESWWGH